MGKTGRIIIIGSGIAGISAATSARSAYPHAEITIVAADPHGFYNRIALDALFTGKRRLRDMYFQPDSWLSRQRITIQTGQTVTHIDADQRRITLEGGTRLPYDSLILATGATPLLPPVPGIDEPNVVPLWSLADSQRIKDALPGKSNVAVLGGGVLGVEAALDIRTMGKQVALIEAAEHLLPMQLPPSMAHLAMDAVAGQGVQVHTGTRASRIARQGESLQVQMEDNSSINVELLLVAAGVRPNMDLARQAGLQTDRGIVVDANMRTSTEGILACGNCIQFSGRLDLLWNPAMAQGAIAGENALETRGELSPDTYPVHLKSADIPLFTIGEPSSLRSGGQVIEQHNETSHKIVVLDQQRRVVYAAFLGNTDGYHTVEKAVRRDWEVPADRIHPDDVDGIVQAFAPPPKDGPMGDGWVCQMCGYTHEGEVPGVCPVCGCGKDQFLAA